MEFLGPYHPFIVHTPVALIVVSLLFELVGLATDSKWWRKAAFAMLIVGVLGAGAAVLSGDGAGEHAEERQGVPEALVEGHEEAGKMALWIGIGAVAARAIASNAGGARAAVAVLAFALHLLAAVTVGVAGYRGGDLVYRHAAGVSLQGEPIRHPGAGAAATGEDATEPGEPEAHESGGSGD